MKRQLAAAMAVLALFGCQQDKAAVEQAREAEQIEFTSGQVLDCAGNLDEAARIVCADADLRALDRRIGELWAEASALTGRPATLAWRHAAWLEERRAGERDWDTDGTRPRTQPELRGFYEAYAAALEEELRQARALPTSTAVSALSGGCIGAALDACRAPAAGFLTGPGGERLAWQVQEGSTSTAGVSSGIILFAISNGVMAPIAWTFDAARFDPPTIFSSGGAVYVSAVGQRAGSGSGNADLLLRLDGDRWSDIETESWQEALAVQLPDGLTVSRGVTYDWPELMATSPLWRDADALCCPSGGTATMDLAVQGSAVTLAALDVREAVSPE